jgi:hypothetical protein
MVKDQASLLSCRNWGLRADPIPIVPAGAQLKEARPLLEIQKISSYMVDAADTAPDNRNFYNIQVSSSAAPDFLIDVLCPNHLEQ